MKGLGLAALGKWTDRDGRGSRSGLPEGVQHRWSLADKGGRP